MSGLALWLAVVMVLAFLVILAGAVVSIIDAHRDARDFEDVYEFGDRRRLLEPQPPP